MASEKDFINFLFRLNDIAQKQREIELQQKALSTAEGLQRLILETQLSSNKQTLEVIRLTRVITLLTVFLVVIGIIQILIMLFK